MQVEAEHFHICPPDHGIEIRTGKLMLTEPDKSMGSRTLIDQSLRALAEDQKENAIGIILSGTGDEGALCLAAIKSAGARPFAGSPDPAFQQEMSPTTIPRPTVACILPVA